MRRNHNWLCLCLLAVVSLTGCKSIAGFQLGAIIGTQHDEIFTYPVKYDKAFLYVIEAIIEADGWSLHLTKHAEGEIIVKKDNLRADLAVLYVKKVDKDITTVELAPDSQTITGIGKLLSQIDEYILAKY